MYAIGPLKIGLTAHLGLEGRGHSAPLFKIFDSYLRVTPIVTEKVEKRVVKLDAGLNGRYCIAPKLKKEGPGICGEPLTGKNRFFCNNAHAARWRKDHPGEKPKKLYKRPKPDETTVVAGEGVRE